MLEVLDCVHVRENFVVMSRVKSRMAPTKFLGDVGPRGAVTWNVRHLHDKC